MKNIRPRKIILQIDQETKDGYQVQVIGGWYQGKETYLWIGDKNGEFVGTIGGGKLLRFAKAVVRHFAKGE